MPYRALFYGPMEPVYPCREMPTRHCPAIYDSTCSNRPCARFESEEQYPWVPEILNPPNDSAVLVPRDYLKEERMKKEIEAVRRADPSWYPKVLMRLATGYPEISREIWEIVVSDNAKEQNMKRSAAEGGTENNSDPKI